MNLVESSVVSASLSISINYGIDLFIITNSDIQQCPDCWRYQLLDLLKSRIENIGGF